MQASVRPYVMAGVATAGVGLIAVTPTVLPPDVPHVSTAAVRLTSSDGLLGLTSATLVVSLATLEASVILVVSSTLAAC